MSDLKENSRNKGPCLGVRHLQAVLLFVNLIVVYICRLNVAVSIVAMTNAAKSNPDYPEYDCNEMQKSYILSSFYGGYVVTQIPGGYWTRRYGAKINLFICTFGTGVFNLMVPFCINWGGWRIYCVLRFIQGAFQGNLYSATLQHLAKWSPPAERNRLGGFAHSGFEFGTVFAIASTGLFAEGPMGWPGVFYISSALCFIWCLLWLVLGANDVSKSKLITLDERAYIEASLRQSIGTQKSKIPIPWRAILTSPPYYALIIARCAQGWGYFTILAELPTYMNGVLDLHIRQNSLFSALPYLSCWLMTYVFMILADLIMKYKLLSLTAMRKSINSVAMWIPAAGLIWFAFLDPAQKTFAVILLAFIVGINSGNIIGTTLGTIDLAPNHAGMLASLLNTCSNATIMLAPLFVGVIVKDEHDRGQWQIVFTVAAFIYCAGDIIFLIWGSAQQQPWNAPDFLQLRDEEKLYEPKYIKKGADINPAFVLEFNNFENSQTSTGNNSKQHVPKQLTTNEKKALAL